MADQEQIQRQLRFLRIDENTAVTLRHLRGLFESSIDDIMSDFYEHILKEPELTALFSDDDAVARARSAQKKHWLDTLFAMEFGQAQFDQSERVARAHVDIGLLPSWYLAAYCFLLNDFIGLFAKHYENDIVGLSRVIQALNKALFLDINLVIENYQAAKDSQMREILQRATSLTEDVKTLNADLVQAARRLHSAVENMTGSDGGVKEIRESSTHLNDQVAKLNARVEQLQFGDRLYFHEPAGNTFLTRMRNFTHRHLRVRRPWR